MSEIIVGDRRWVRPRVKEARPLINGDTILRLAGMSGTTEASATLPDGAVLLDADVAAVAAEACELLASTNLVLSPTDGPHKVTDKGRSHWLAAARALRGEG